MEGKEKPEGKTKRGGQPDGTLDTIQDRDSRVAPTTSPLGTHNHVTTKTNMERRGNKKKTAKRDSRHRTGSPQQDRPGNVFAEDTQLNKQQRDAKQVQ